MTYKEQRVLKHRLAGESLRDSVRAAGLPAWMARRSELQEVEALVEEATTVLAAQAFERELIDAAEIHEYLSDALRADMRDIRNDDGSFKAQSEWPEIWGRMMEAGDCEVETLSQRSHDGATKDKAGGWDVTDTVTKVKLKFASRTRLLELAMRHKAVDALAAQKQDLNVSVTISAERQRQVASGRQRLGRIVDVEPELEAL